MVESESFIKEVSEEVKRDKLFKALNKFKWPLFALIILLVGTVGGYEYYKFDKKRKAQENGEFLVSAIENLYNNGETVSSEIENKFIAILIKLHEAKYFEEKSTNLRRNSIPRTPRSITLFNEPVCLDK